MVNKENHEIFKNKESNQYLYNYVYIDMDYYRGKCGDKIKNTTIYSLQYAKIPNNDQMRDQEPELNIFHLWDFSSEKELIFNFFKNLRVEADQLIKLGNLSMEELIMLNTKYVQLKEDKTFIFAQEIYDNPSAFFNLEREASGMVGLPVELLNKVQNNKKILNGLIKIWFTGKEMTEDEINEFKISIDNQIREIFKIHWTLIKFIYKDNI